MGITLASGLRSLFLVLCCIMTGTTIYAIYIDGLPFRKDVLLTLLTVVSLLDFNLIALQFAIWIYYKETNLISAIVWIILILSFGSITTTAYVFIQFLKLSPQESAQDPIYHVLLRHEHKNVLEQKRKNSSVLAARITFIVLGCSMFSIWTYTMVTGGLFFLTKEFYTPWNTDKVVDFYIDLTVLLVWVVYKESTWLTACLWVILLLIFGSTCASVYIVLKLMQLTYEDPLYLVLLN
ncbi:uncharacterized protein [Euphorbia lathyris]|uniref:uncharacterized protein n=1 Tax=Euphorbia lathyris TaxID=212925 RepID=UPI0033141D25